jgi:hypothetical protein
MRKMPAMRTRQRRRQNAPGHKCPAPSTITAEFALNPLVSIAHSAAQRR